MIKIFDKFVLFGESGIYNKLRVNGIKTDSKSSQTTKAVKNTKRADKGSQSDESLKVKSTTSRSRFRMSKISGRNLRRHPFSQDKANPTLGRVNSGFQPSRIDDIGPRQVVLRASLKDLYGIHTSSATRSPIARPYNKWKRGMVNIDRSVGVLLHRSGLANSIEHARQLVTHGHVYMKVNKDKVRLLHRPTHVVPVGALVYINKLVSGLAKSNAVQWSKWNIANDQKHLSTSKTETSGIDQKDVNSVADSVEIKRNIPSYLEVDYINGSFVLVNETDSNTVLLPAGLGVTLKAILR